MTTKFGFNSTAVQSAADEYQKVELPKEYRKLMEDISSVMAPVLGMNDLAIRGFISRAIVEWQRRKKIRIASVLNMSIENRKIMMKEGMGVLNEILLPLLKTDKDKDKLKASIDAGYDAYLKKFINQIK